MERHDNSNGVVVSNVTVVVTAAVDAAAGSSPSQPPNNNRHIAVDRGRPSGLAATGLQEAVDLEGAGELVGGE